MEPRRPVHQITEPAIDDTSPEARIRHSEQSLPSPEPSSRTPIPVLRHLAVVALCLFVFVFALWQSSAKLHTSPFHPDESRWVNRAVYLDELRHPLSSFWEDRYLIRGQPPMGSYMIGLGLLLQGKDLHTNGPWDFQYGFETAITWNLSHGNMPSFDNLIAARQWNMVLGALTCVMLVLIVGTLVNWVGGAAAGLFMAIHPLHIYLSTLAVSDAMFTTFVAASVLAAIWLARKPTWGRSLLLALALGMGAATKLSPLVIALGWSLYALILFADPWLRSNTRTDRFWSVLSRKERGTERQLGWKLLVQTGLVGSFFILVYPFLWSDPIGHTRALFAFRRSEMDNQARIFPNAAVHSRGDALQRTWTNLQDITSTSGRIVSWIGDRFGNDWSGHGLDLYLSLPGLVVLIYLAWKGGIASPQMLGMLAIVAQSALILGALGVEFNRYYEPLVFAAAACSGVLIGWLANVLWGAACRYHGPVRTPSINRNQSAVSTPSQL